MIKLKISSKKQTIILIMFLLSILKCMRINDPIENNYTHNKKIFALKGKENQWGGDLYYSYYDILKFKQIDGCNEIINIHINKKNDLAICATNNKLLFVNTITNKKIKEISIPNTENPEPYLGFTTISLFPCYWSDDHVILCNWSVFLVNLKTMSLERIIYNAWNSDKIVYTRFVNLSDDSTSLYLMLDLYGAWVEGNIGRIEIRQRLAELDLAKSQIETIYNYPREDPPGYKCILNSNNYILALDYNAHSIIRFSVSNGDSIDCFYINDSLNISYPYSLGYYIVFHDTYTGNFYIIDPMNKSIELYMMFDLINLDSSNVNVSYTNYQIMEGGDVYACFRLLSSNESLIVNLTKKQVMQRFKSEFYQMYLYE